MQKGTKMNSFKNCKEKCEQLTDDELKQRMKQLGFKLKKDLNISRNKMIERIVNTECKGDAFWYRGHKDER